ncbi:MAG: toll/interleukin-1 receptor domain-containing protein, partial [Chryseobacterium sp.]
KNIKIVNLILEFFGKLRETRKVFISYRRDQSTSVAIQLYEALERNNFDVFLDTHSIKQGEPFQDELWHRMTDCDVIVLLNTSKFLGSKWCKEEIAQASTKKIGVIQLVWPDHELENMAELSFPRKLDNADFIGGIPNNSVSSRLNETVISQVIEEVESVRARTLASRQDDIITNFMNVAKRYKRKVNIQPERFITEELGEGKRRIFIPTVGIPQSINCEQSSELRKEIIEFSVDEINLIYDNLSIRERWIKHLAYLNQYLDVKTLKKSEIETVWNPELVKNIFLSASIPLATRKPTYFETADIVAIRDAVIALTTAVLPKHRLIWGGHPSITPLIYDVMDRLGLNIQEHVTLYQSKYYQYKFPEDNFKFENIILTESTGEKASSEEIMRSKMLDENGFAAAVFI